MSFPEIEKQAKTIRPAVLPDNKKFVFYPIIIGAAISLSGIFFDNRTMFLAPLIAMAIFPGLPIFAHLIFHIFVKIEIHPEKVVVTDYARNGFVKIKSFQEICYDDICYAYYLGKEINLLLNFREKLKKFDILAEEANYTKANLSDRYGVPSELFHQYEKNTQKLLTDFTATSVIMELDNICQKYHIPKAVTKNIKKALGNDTNFNYTYLETALKEYHISSEDLFDLKDEFTNINTDILTPFLTTNVKLDKYKNTEERQPLITVKTDIGLVLSNKDGSSKVYLMHFHNLSDKDLLGFIEMINSRNPNIRYLMTQREIKRLSRKHK